MSIDPSTIYNTTCEYANKAAEALVNSRNSTVKFLKTNLPEEVVTKVSRMELMIKDSEISQQIHEQGTSPSAISVTLLGFISGANISENPFTASLMLGSACLLARTKTQFALLTGSALTGAAAYGMTSLYGRAHSIPLG